MEPRITLGVSDLDRSIAFCRDGLGLPHPLEKLAEDAEVPAAGEGLRGFTLAHNMRSPDEVDATLE